MPQNYSWFLNEEETKIDVFLLLFGGSAFPIKVTSFFIWCDINELFFFSWCYFYGPFCILNAINGRYVLIDRLPSERLIFPLSKGEKRGVLQQKIFENKEKFSILIALELIAVLFEMYLPCFCKKCYQEYQPCLSSSFDIFTLARTLQTPNVSYKIYNHCD